jgi:hypothetical protein
VSVLCVDRCACECVDKVGVSVRVDRWAWVCVICGRECVGVRVVCVVVCECVWCVWGCAT